MSSFRIGNGYDVHRLVEGRKLILGGVDIPHDKGLDGHSDADALCHAICDALLGAVGAGDIGHYFPDTDPQWKGISSLLLLEKVGQMVKKQGWYPGNNDRYPRDHSHGHAQSQHPADHLHRRCSGSRPVGSRRNPQTHHRHSLIFSP